MKGVVIDKGQEYFTSLKSIFHSIDNIQKDYNWLITEQECYPQNEKYIEKLSSEWCWITGEELTEMIEDEDFQWIWGVFSAFPKGITKEEVLKNKLPQAEGNNRIWQNPIGLQNPLSLIEIIAWDSSMTIFISSRDEIVEKLVARNPLAKDLEKYNISVAYN